MCVWALQGFRTICLNITVTKWQLGLTSYANKHNHTHKHTVCCTDMAAISYHLSCLTANEMRQMEKETASNKYQRWSQDWQTIYRRLTDGQMLGETEKRAAVTRKSERWSVNCCKLVFHRASSHLGFLKTEGNFMEFYRVNIHCAHWHVKLFLQTTF